MAATLGCGGYRAQRFGDHPMIKLLAELLPFAFGLAITPAAIASCILSLGSAGR